MSVHIPVMLAEVLEALAVRAGATYLDATFGGGGYARAILAAAPCTLWAIDRDPAAIARGAALAEQFPGRLHLIEGRFGAMLDLLADQGVTALDGVALDLGVSSFQIDQPERGFSFRADGPLDMRMGGPHGVEGGPSAADLVNTLDAEDLAKILREFGEERHAGRAARAIVRARTEAPIATTGQLAGILRRAIPKAKDGIDPATRGFQALRIAVNDELGELSRALEAAARLLRPGGRLVVVSFHSLEDRVVKRFLREAAGLGPAPSRHDPASLLARPEKTFRLLHRDALEPGGPEIAANPRARSAKLRAAERLGVAA
jgi:16S rRNA (cytosine1402-N4)-methyltransferase